MQSGLFMVTSPFISPAAILSFKATVIWLRIWIGIALTFTRELAELGVSSMCKKQITIFIVYVSWLKLRKTWNIIEILKTWPTFKYWKVPGRKRRGSGKEWNQIATKAIKKDKCLIFLFVYLSRWTFLKTHKPKWTCGGWDSNPRTPTGMDPKSIAFNLARQPPPSYKGLT